jgi:alkaline phosphatase D
MVVCDIDRNWGVEAIVQGDYDEPRGRELEIADFLSFIKRNAIRNTVRLPANVHCSSAQYDPDDAAFQDFDPFSEFVSGPIHAGAYGANKLDKTFRPQIVYQQAPTQEQAQYGLQFFGHVAIDGATEVMTVTLKDVDDNALCRHHRGRQEVTDLRAGPRCPSPTSELYSPQPDRWSLSTCALVVGQGSEP